VLTPGWTWHDHGHLGTEPVIWLDALDNPFGQFFGAIFRENYPEEAQAPSLAAGDAGVRYGSNLMPLEYRTDRRSSPLLVYPYDRTREALERLAKAGPLHPAHGIKMRYANPLNGGYVYPTIAVFIQWLPQGFSSQSYRSTDGTVFTVVEGSGRAHIGDVDIAFEPHDVFVVPTVDALSPHGRKRMRVVQPVGPRGARGVGILARAGSLELDRAAIARISRSPAQYRDDGA
jgi:gentisate 1,2-dioxygenase